MKKWNVLNLIGQFASNNATRSLYSTLIFGLFTMIPVWCSDKPVKEKSTSEYYNPSYDKEYVEFLLETDGWTKNLDWDTEEHNATKQKKKIDAKYYDRVKESLMQWWNSTEEADKIILHLMIMVGDTIQN